MAQIDDSFNARLALAAKAITGGGRPLSRVLAIHLGENSKAGLEAFLAKAPPATLALYLHRAGGSVFSPLERHEAALRGAIVEQFDMSGFLRERIFAALETSHAANISLNSSFEIPQESLRWIQDAAIDGFEKRNNRMRSSQTRLRCALANLPQMAGSGRMALPSFDPSDPLIICGAGPSLTAQLEHIMKNQRNAIIVCAGRSAKMLAEAGIQPDYIVDIEQNAQLYWPEGMRFKGVLVAHESIAPVVPASFSKYIWTDCGLNPLRGLLAAAGITLPSIPANGPVASIMIGFAVASGARRIALCGYDLALAPDGKSYADGLGSMDKGSAKTLMVPSAAAGEQAETLPHFEAMRRDVQGTIDILRRSGLLFELYNCSPSGAMIAGARPMTLESFISAYAKDQKSHSADFTPISSRLPDALCAELSESGKALEAIESLAKQLSKIHAELSGSSPDLNAAQKQEMLLDPLFKGELATRNNSELSTAAFTQASLIAEQWPVKPPQSELEARLGLCRNILRQSLLHKGLLEDAIADAREVLKSLEAQRAPKIDVHTHPALRAHAVRLIRQQNPELAEILACLPPGAKAKGFETLSKLFSPPVAISMECFSGERLELCDPSSYTEEVKASAESILRESAFDPALDAIILSGHVNWGLASEIAFRHPGAKLLLVFPWLELLSQMADSCEFMGLLPEGTLLLCPRETCPKWKELLAQRLALWKGGVRRMLLFENQATSSLPECKAASEAVKEFLKQP